MSTERKKKVMGKQRRSEELGGEGLHAFMAAFETFKGFRQLRVSCTFYE
jgi:hypothetical protein